eukprot:12494858-Heterocapsa_arctica.AAC.1
MKSRETDFSLASTERHFGGTCSKSSGADPLPAALASQAAHPSPLQEAADTLLMSVRLHSWNVAA